MGAAVDTPGHAAFDGTKPTMSSGRAFSRADDGQ